MLEIKLTPYRKSLGTIYHRQTPGGTLVSPDGRYRFHLDDDREEYDFWVVQGKGLREAQTVRVAPENTIFMATEPRSILVYPPSYLRQFGLVYTCQEQTRHPNVHLGPAVLPWFVGYSDTPQGCEYTLDYDNLIESPTPEKTKLLSVITSNKAFTQGHIDRIRFVAALKQHFQDRIDIYGRGFRDFDDKWDVLAPYRYHIAIENCSDPYYWTEKLADCYLTETFPIYYGCRNADNYFPDNAFQNIDIRQPKLAIEIIERIIEADTAGEAAFTLRQCKNLVLGKYNLFGQIATLCDTLDAHAVKRDVTLQPCRSGLYWRNFVNYTFTRNYYKAKMRLTGRSLNL